MYRYVCVAAAILLPLMVLGRAAVAQGTEPTTAPDPRAAALVRAAVDHYRGESSRAELIMTIHREDWQRSMTLRAWTGGDDHSLVRVLAPARDAGNASLSVQGSLWSYTPKLNRVVRIPSSMMARNWMGSDFSNQDISRSADIVDQYRHELLGQSVAGGHRSYRIRSTPREDAPVVWGFEVLHIRDDHVLLEHQFWDQAGELVKTLEALEIEEMSGRPVASRLRMSRHDEPGRWTELHTRSIEFDLELPQGIFTLSWLRNPRR